MLGEPMDVQTVRCDTSTEARETHERILEAAQKFFAEKGFDATSVRDITAEAGCNVAAVNYHFGGKENLYLESFRVMLESLRDQRLAVLDGLMRRDPTPTLEEFLATFASGFLDPLVDESKGRLFLVFVSREMLDPRLPPVVFLEEFIHPLVDRVMEALATVGPPMPPETALRCVLSLIGQLLHAFKAHHVLTQLDLPHAMSFDLAAFLEHFVRFSSGGIRACALDETSVPVPLFDGENPQ
jgi:AcrR family transcriptional regulator